MAEIAEVRQNHNGSVTKRNHHQGYHTLPAAARGNNTSRGNTNTNLNHSHSEEGSSNEEFTGEVESGTIAPMPSPILPTLTAHKGPLLRPGSMVELRSGIRLEKIKKPRERERDRHNNHHDTLSKWASQDSLHHRLLLFVYYILIHMVLDILPTVMNSCLICLGLHTVYGLYGLNPLTLGSGPHFTEGWYKPSMLDHHKQDRNGIRVSSNI